MFDKDTLTIGFARRFATYKRANLILQDMEALVSLVGHPQTPIQFVFAGKAHPHDGPGKEVLQQVAQLALSKQVKQWNAKRGVAIVMDVRNGELLASSVPAPSLWAIPKDMSASPEDLRKLDKHQCVWRGLKALRKAAALARVWEDSTARGGAALTVGAGRGSERWR